jgi:hypothetical protein
LIHRNHNLKKLQKLKRFCNTALHNHNYNYISIENIYFKGNEVRFLYEPVTVMGDKAAITTGKAGKVQLRMIR